MRSSGSVLIVVLGLLAILAIVGITFVTMSSLDRSTATNFAIQSQFILAADGAVDYVCHHLVMDLWEYTPSTGTYKDRLLTDANTATGLIRNEPYDFPGTEDPWLATAVDAEDLPAAPTAQRSYDLAVTGTPPFGLKDQWGSTGAPSGEFPNNLGFPSSNKKVSMYTQGNGHAVWIPDLSFPFETGLIRVSVTVQDHNAMINLNAHGNTVEEKWRLGYFVSDVYPDSLGFDVRKLVENTDPPGLWKEAGKPGNLNQLAAVIENPGKFRDRVFTLDEEFELRRLTGSLFKSRIEEFARGALDSDPETATPAKAAARASCTTVSWTSQVRFDRQDAATAGYYYTTAPIYSPRKVDLNLDKVEAISGALKDGYVFDEKTEPVRIGQFAANVMGFRNGDVGVGIKTYGTSVGASAQPLISKIEATRGNSGSQGVDWSIKVQVISPWPRNTPFEDVGLSLSGITLTVGGATPASTKLPAAMQLETSALSPKPEVIDAKVTVPSGQTLAGVVQSIRLNCLNKIIDEVDSLCITELEQKKTYHRKIGLEDEKRYDGDQRPVRVVYIGIWEEGLNGTIDAFTRSDMPDGAIPIRFPRSVFGAATPPTKGLPPFLMADEGGNPIRSYKSFARLGDLNQVLCPKDETEAKVFWPWTTRVAKASGVTAERLVKFNWDAPAPDKATVTRLNAANVFTVGGPWNDRIDNDSDGFADEDGPSGFYGPDEGMEIRGEFGGPEIRVAGQINLNTATLATLQALESGFGLSGLAARVVGCRPLKSPAQILTGYNGRKVGDEAKGQLEETELLYSRISNVATVRSDTFSIYGTVQYIDTTLMVRALTGSKLDRERAVRRSRRFWALVDRSPSLAYNPTQDSTTGRFIRPRVLNFQWLD